MTRKLALLWALFFISTLPLYGQEPANEETSPGEANASQDAAYPNSDTPPAMGPIDEALSAADQLYEAAQPTPDADPVIAGIRRAYQEDAENANTTSGAGDASGPPEDSFYRQSLQAVAVLCVICGLVVLSGYVMRRFGKGTPLLAGPSLGQELGRIYINPKASLHYVRSGGRILVIGVTPQSMNLITEFDQDSFEDGDRTKTTRPTIRPFETELNRSAARMEGRGVDDEDFDALRGDIKRLQQYLQDSAREHQ